MIDLHCHILPGLDDGSSSAEESLAMARLALQDGIRTIVATPHALDGVYNVSFKAVAEGAASFQKLLITKGLELQVLVGSDVHLCPGMADKIKKGTVGTINNTGR